MLVIGMSPAEATKRVIAFSMSSLDRRLGSAPFR